MAENITDDITSWLELNIRHKDYLGQVRHWDNLKVATDAESIWVKDFTSTQLEAPELRSIPFASLYFCKDNLLFPKGNLLPSRKQPAFLWTPIERALPIQLNGFNHNFFRLHQQQLIELVHTEEEQNASVLLTDIDTADRYIINAPAVRLKPLQWTLVNNSEVLVIGEPLLPLDGKAFWQSGKFIFPVGYKFEFAILQKIAARKIDAGGTNLLWWHTEHCYCLISPAVLQPLSIASWKHTIHSITPKQI